ncbi:MAG TPA: S9 family peptidase, partial [Acidobacteriota bacterium]|nr:S9 family peptidase [Acidobacteriota bacterium]
LAPTPLVDDSYMRRKIHIVDAVAGSIQTRFETPGKLGAVAWSPDGRHLAVIAGANPNDPREGRLTVGAVDGTELTDILPDFKGHVRCMTWTDNETIRFLGDQGVESFVGEIGRSGGTVRMIVPPESESDRPVPVPDLSTGRPVMSSVSWSVANGATALGGESPLVPPEVYYLPADASEPVQLTVSNPWLTERRLAVQEVVEYEARDGLKIQGILIRPLDEEPGKRYPLIVQVHGGPESHYRNGWMTWYSALGQVFAARGFAVFYPNYRTGTGRGVEFSMLGFGDPAGKEFDDIVDGVDHLVKIGLVDRDRVGVTGGSYGGYASAWCATYYSEHFAASVMLSGVSDQISKIGTTDIPKEMIEVHFRRPPWDDWQFFLERSPIYYADRSRTATLIVHGKDDARVDVGQARELYRHLKMRGKAPVRLVLYPGEKHGNSKAAARLDCSLRLLRWMEHYLVGPGGEPPPYELEYERPEKKG